MNLKTEPQNRPLVEPSKSAQPGARPQNMWFKHGPLLVVLAMGLVVRLVLLYMTHDTRLMIVDEQHYYRLALNLLHGHGFAREPGALTSIRPPLYPVFMALVWRLTGTESLLPVRMAQILLSLANVLVLYRLGLLLFNRRVGLIAATGFCFYPSLVGFNFLMLTEVLFTLLLTLMSLCYVVLMRTGKASFGWGAGCLLGLAALTRGILWPFPVVLCPLVFLSLSGHLLKRLNIVLFLCLGYAIVVAPWAVRNTELQGVFTVVNTMGGLVLRMGNYEHTPLNRAWDPVTLSGKTSIFQELYQEHPDASTWTEGRKEKWAMKKALVYMLEHPSITLKRAVIKFANFWGLERSIIAGWQQGLYQPPRWLALAGTLAITFSYMLLMLSAGLGFSLARPEDRKTHLFFFLIIVFIAGIHSIIFGHSRYHLPLIPLLSLYAAAAWNAWNWLRLREGVFATAVRVAVWVGLFVIWGREVLIVEADRIQGFLRVFFS
jgi:4-amino-4-deoxy-L-arabinose transferase-like glycosyltransferase